MGPNRRQFLIASGASFAGLFAGCQGTEKMGTDTGMTAEPTNTPTMTPRGTTASGGSPTATPSTGSTPTDTPDPTPTATATPTATPTPAPNTGVNITDSQLQKEKTSYDTTASVVATVENQGSDVAGQLQVEARFYNDSDELLGTNVGVLHHLKPGETWECYVPYLDDGSDVKSHEVDGEYSTEAPRLAFDDLAVTDTSLQKGEYGASVTGTVENDLDQEADYLAANARFWRGDVILANGLDNVTDVPAGQDWSFEARYMGYGDRWEDADDYDVVPGLTIY